jgi:hypothetical protein
MLLVASFWQSAIDFARTMRPAAAFPPTNHARGRHPRGYYEKYVMSRFERKQRTLNMPNRLIAERNSGKIRAYVTARPACEHPPNYPVPGYSG